jgi:dihydroxyacetone kinase-like protein
MEAGKASLGWKEVGIEDLVIIGQAGIDGVKKRGKSEVGDKTMLDSLVPAVETFREQLAEGVEHKVAIEATIKAAKEGMEATVSMQAKHSRASWRQGRGVGVQDPGATAMYHLIEEVGKRLLPYT